MPTVRDLAQLAACLVVLATGVAIMYTAGCVSDTTGVLRPIHPQIERTITNAMSAAVTVADTAMPFPWSNVFQAAGGAALTLLAAWQAFTHAKVKKNAAALAAALPELKL